MNAFAPTTSENRITDHRIGYKSCLDQVLGWRSWRVVRRSVAADGTGATIMTSRAGDDAVKLGESGVTCVRRSTWLLRYWRSEGSTRRVATLCGLAFHLAGADRGRLPPVRP